jgi:methyl-accepting chemotaxis protein
VVNLCKKWVIDIERSGGTLQELSKESNNIEGNDIESLLNDIRSLTDQTNPLLFNTAIKAARAVEQERACRRN